MRSTSGRPSIIEDVKVGAMGDSGEKRREGTCRCKAIRDDVRGGGLIGGVGELKDLDETRVKLSTDLEFRMLLLSLIVDASLH